MLLMLATMLDRRIILFTTWRLRTLVWVWIGITVLRVTRRSRLLLAGLATVVLPSQASAQASDTGRSVTLGIAVAPGLDEALAMENALRGRVRDHLKRRGVSVAVEADSRLTVGVSRYENSSTDFRVSIVVVRGEQVLGKEVSTCQLCGATEVFDSVAMGIEAVLDSIPTEPQPARQEPQKPVDLQPTQHPRILGPLGWSGVGVGVVGFGAVGVGAYLLGRGEERRVNTDDPRSSQTVDFRPTGWAVLGVGSVAVLAGVAMVATNAIHRRRGHTLSFVPILQPRAAGGLIAGRF